MLECWKRVEDWRGLCERKQISSTNRHFWNFTQIIGLFVQNFLDANIPMNTSNTNNTIVLSLLHLDPIKRTWHIQAVFSAKVRELPHYIYLIVYLSERWDLTNFTQKVYKHTTLQQIQALIYLRRLKVKRPGREYRYTGYGALQSLRLSNVITTRWRCLYGAIIFYRVDMLPGAKACIS